MIKIKGFCGIIFLQMELTLYIVKGTCFGDSCFLFSSTAQTWQNCKKYCENLHANLVKIETEEENNFLYSNTGGTFYWAGANDLETEGTWLWTDGSAVIWTAWLTGQPDNYQKIQHCLTLYKYQATFKWLDSNCVANLLCLCEKPNQVVAVCDREFEGSCYYISNSGKTWNECKAYCEGLGAHLVKIESTQENQFISTTTTSDIFYWTGARDIVTEGTWLWTDGSLMDFSAWSSTEPNNVNNNEHCMAMISNLFTLTMYWFDHGCHAEFFCFCEKSTAMETTTSADTTTGPATRTTTQTQTTPHQGTKDYCVIKKIKYGYTMECP